MRATYTQQFNFKIEQLMFEFTPKLFFISVEEDSYSPEGMIWIGNNSGYYMENYGYTFRGTNNSNTYIYFTQENKNIKFYVSNGRNAFCINGKTYYFLAVGV